MLPPLNVYTDLDPQMLNEVGLRVYRLWVQFALGNEELGGRTIMHPTGRYASSISYRRYGRSHVAVIADEKLAPEADILETGHRPIDLKQSLMRGRAYPMHRGRPGQWGSAGYGTPVLAQTGPGRRRAKQRNLWGAVRAQGFSGFATVGTSGWIIPAMRAYSPAAILRDLIEQQYGQARVIL